MPLIEHLETRVAVVPTDAPESDGTLAWDSTTIVLVRAHAGGEIGLGWTYGDAAIAAVIEGSLRELVEGRDAHAPPAAWLAMQQALRNDGRVGIGAMAISAVDVALWELAARLHETPLATLLGRHREEVPIYGSGGFTSYTNDRLAEQLGGWAAEGMGRVKMKVGRHPEDDPERLRVAREAIGPDVELFVDANGAFSTAEALGWAERYAEFDVRWFEEPVSSDDHAGLALVRDRAPAGMAVTTGEYGYTLRDFRPWCEAVHVLQADVTRCLGITGLRQVAALAQAHQLPLSGHCAPAIHASVGCALEPLVHLEYFHDHARIERLLFDGVPEPEGGALRPALDRPGLGVELREDAWAEHAP